MDSLRRSLVVSAATVGLLGGCDRRSHINRRTQAPSLDRDRLAAGMTALDRAAAPGRLSLGVMTLDTPGVWGSDPDRQFPNVGIVQGLVAAAALAEVDAGRLTFNETLPIARQDLSPPPSLLNRTLLARGSGKISVPVADLIGLAVQTADPTAVDSLLRRIGGPGAVTAWLRAHGVEGLRVDRYERETRIAATGLESFHDDWGDDAAWSAARGQVTADVRESAMDAVLADPRDTITAQSVLNVLGQLTAGRLLSKPSSALLLRLMRTNTRSDKGLTVGAPAGATLDLLAGQTATDLGRTVGHNAAGLATLADGRRLAVVALLAGSTATRAQRDAVFADAMRLAVSAVT